MYCGKCEDECDLDIIWGQIEYEVSEFWGQTQLTTNRVFDIVSDCCESDIYVDTDFEELLDPSEVQDLIWLRE